MIEISEHSFTGACSSCQSNKNLKSFNFGVADPINNTVRTGIKVTLCEECRKELIEKLKEE